MALTGRKYTENQTKVPYMSHFNAKQNMFSLHFSWLDKMYVPLTRRTAWPAGWHWQWSRRRCSRSAGWLGLWWSLSQPIKPPTSDPSPQRRRPGGKGQSQMKVEVTSIAASWIFDLNQDRKFFSDCFLSFIINLKLYINITSALLVCCRNWPLFASYHPSKAW